MKIKTLNSGESVFLSKQVQSHHVFDFLLKECKRVDTMVISSFAITEAYIRRIIRNRNRIGHITLFLDFTIATRNPRLTFFASSNVDELYLTNNHSKLIYVSGDNISRLALMSNNATNNHRFESGVILSNPNIVKYFADQITEMKNDSVLFNGINE